MCLPAGGAEGHWVTCNKAQQRAQRKRCGLATPVRLVVQSLLVVYRGMRRILLALRKAQASSTRALMDSTLRSFAARRRRYRLRSMRTARATVTEASMTTDGPCSRTIESSHRGDLPSDPARDVGRSLPGAPLHLTETKPTRISSDPPTLTFAASSALMGADSPPQMSAHAFHRALIPDHTIAGVPRSQRIDIGRQVRDPQAQAPNALEADS